MVYLSYQLNTEDEEQVEFSEQQFYNVLLCGPTSYENRSTVGNTFLEHIVNELKGKHEISVEKIVRGVGFSNK